MMAEDWGDNTDAALREMVSKTKFSSRICNGLIIFHTIGAILYIIGIPLTADLTDRTTELPLMMQMEYPFVIDTQYKYRLVLATQLISAIVASWGAGLFNALFLTLVTSTYISKYHKQNIIIYPSQLIYINIKLKIREK